MSSASSDEDFMQYVRRRPARFYVGGFRASITEQKIVKYVLRRGMTVTRVYIRKYEDQDRAVIQLNVNPDDGPRLLESGFWPPGVFCRLWYPRNEYSMKISMNSDTYSRGRDESGHNFVD